METILAINPGSTSTKIAVYKDEEPLFVESIAHSLEEVGKYENVFDQYEFRLNVIIEALEKHGVKPEDLTCVVSRCGLLPPINSGAYNINEDMLGGLGEACPVLASYAHFIALVRRARDNGCTLSLAVNEAVETCIDEGVLVGYLRRHRAEVKDMFLTEYDQERHDRCLREEGRKEGRKEGQSESRKRFLDRAVGLVRAGELTLADAARIFGFAEEDIDAAISAMA